MKRTFCLLAMMAFFAIPQSAEAKEISPLKKVRRELIQDYVEEAAAQERLEPTLLSAIIQVESNFNHKAVSPVGAKGLMQIMPFTAIELGKRKALDSRNPRANILAGAHYLRGLINQFQGDLRLAVAAYNAGPNAVLKHRGIPPFSETQNYVTKVMNEWHRLRALQ
ncbi:MAG: lytic transglycosylase domain-containing protein [Bdellovibrionota bacterium]